MQLVGEWKKGGANPIEGWNSQEVRLRLGARRWSMNLGVVHMLSERRTWPKRRIQAWIFIRGAASFPRFVISRYAPDWGSSRGLGGIINVVIIGQAERERTLPSCPVQPRRVFYTRHWPWRKLGGGAVRRVHYEFISENYGDGRMAYRAYTHTQGRLLLMFAMCCRRTTRNLRSGKHPQMGHDKGFYCAGWQKNSRGKHLDGTHKKKSRTQRVDSFQMRNDNEFRLITLFR